MGGVTVPAGTVIKSVPVPTRPPAPVPARPEELDGPVAPQADLAGAVDEFSEFNDKTVRFKFKRLKDRQPGESWILLYYGASKSGKTFFAGSAGARTLFLNVGDGIETLMAPAFTQKYPEARDMIMVDIREMAPNDSADAFDMTTDVLDHALLNFPDKFDTIVLDEATAFRNVTMNKATELNSGERTQGKSRPNRIQEYMKVDIGDYGEEMKMVEWFLAQYVPIFKEKNKNFLMLAHERQIFTKPARIGDEPTLNRIVPGFTGKTFPDKVPAYFDDVWHAEVILDASGNAVYRARTAGNAMELGGARHGGIFNIVEPNPNYIEMLKRIKLAQPKPTNVRR